MMRESAPKLKHEILRTFVFGWTPCHKCNKEFRLERMYLHYWFHNKGLYFCNSCGVSKSHTDELVAYEYDRFRHFQTTPPKGPPPPPPMRRTRWP